MVLGGTGAMGGAVASRLAATGWEVHVTGRNPASMPAELIRSGVTFHQVDRSDVAATGRLVGDGTDLLVDLVAFSAQDVRTLVPVMAGVGSIVLVSSRAVYADRQGRHVNAGEAPRFDRPVREEDATVPPAPEGTDPFSRLGYAPSKVAAERAALDSGLPVTVLRPAKVHGRWARQARTRPFVAQMLAGVPAIGLASAGSVDHLTAASNVAALVETVADVPGRRVLNVADPDTPPASEIVAAIGRALGWEGRVELLEPGAPGGDHPWRAVHPFVLDTGAARALGYEPVGQAVTLLAEEVGWVAAGRRPPRTGNGRDRGAAPPPVRGGAVT